MKTLLSIIVATCGLAAIADSTVAIPGIGEANVTCAEENGWKFDVRAEEKADGTAELVISLSSADASPRVPPKFDVAFSVPQKDAWHRWSMESEKVTMPPDWRSALEPRLCFGFPLVAFLGGDDRNRLAVAVSEAKRRVRIDAGLREENARLTWKIAFFSEPEAPISAYEVKLRFDKRDVFFGDAVREGMEWIVREDGIHPAPVPEAAFDPLYSSWYSFHQNLFDGDVEAECALAAKMGMKVVIVDDGWQTEDTNRGYAFCGDWEVSKRRFPSMAAHVAKVHAFGMKYMVWYSVPFVGEESRNFARFKGKYLYINKSKRAGILDPRFPEVRSFLSELYAKALREWDIDGLKLDFIDNFRFDSKDPAVAENYAGRDIKSLPEAVDRLMKEIHAAVTSVKPDALVEFRQQYVGPGMRQYGNMFRAYDCPGDATANRCRIANLRLTSGKTAVHADMLMWNTEDAPESAARFVLSSIFGVVQYSMMLRTLPESHRKMIAHWVDFSQKHRDALLRGNFRPRRFSQMYPLIESENVAERIVAVYGNGTVADLGAMDRDIYLLNATTGEDVVVDFCCENAQAEAFDTFGASVGMIHLKRGVQRIKMPKCGYLRICK